MYSTVARSIVITIPEASVVGYMEFLGEACGIQSLHQFESAKTADSDECEPESAESEDSDSKADEGDEEGVETGDENDPDKPAVPEPAVPAVTVGCLVTIQIILAVINDCWFIFIFLRVMLFDIHNYIVH